MKYPFKSGRQYSRRDILKLLALPVETVGGPWFPGIAEHEGAFFIMCNVGAAGRTGHNYGNRFVDGELHWSGATGSKVQHKRYSALIAPGERKIYIFYRERDRDRFTFAGLGTATNWEDRTPVKKFLGI